MRGAIAIIDPREVRDLAPDVIGPGGAPRVMPADYYRATTRHERAMLGHLHAAYLLPTVELIDWLLREIGGRRAIEIGAGNGVLGAALGIPATDNMMQAHPAIAALYTGTGQAPVRYGANVEDRDANAAVESRQPEVVVAAWVTHKYDPARHELGGNAWGVDEGAVIDACDTYIFIGNRNVHANKPIWTRPHRIIEPDWLYSRAHNGSPEFIAIWEKK